MKLQRFLSALLALTLTLVLLPFGAKAAEHQTVEQAVRAMGILTGDASGSLHLEQSVTRAEFAKMMVSASSLHASVGQASTVSPFSDVKHDYWAAEYIRTAVTAGWLFGYVDGSFLPAKTILLEEAAAALLRMLGYGQNDLIGGYPTAHLAKYHALGLDEGLSLNRGDVVTRRDCLYLFYNLMSAQTNTGQLYGTTLGYAVNTSGELDYAALVDRGIKGPYLISGADWAQSLPFDPVQADFYRNGSPAKETELMPQDVYYYHKNLRTVWAYSSSVTGLYTAALPNAATPASVTVGGNTYSIGSSDAAYKLSSSGRFRVGEQVTLLLGRNGEVVEVLSAQAGQGRYYGQVTAVGPVGYETSTGLASREMLSLLCTDGVIRQFIYGGESYKPGDLVQAILDQGTAQITRLPISGLEGLVDRSGTGIASLQFASDIEILEVTASGSAPLTTSRIAGARLEKRHVPFYAQDGAGRITHLILRDVSGDYNTYGIITHVQQSERVVNDIYTNTVNLGLLVNGKPSAVVLTDTLRQFSTGAALLQLGDQTLQDATTLPEVTLTHLSQEKATATSRQFTLSPECQVYILEKGSYTPATLAQVSNLQQYTLAGYYDTGYPAGSLIRILVATRK